MLLIETRIGPSPVHGIGLFAAHTVARGTPVWRFTPPFDLELPPSSLDALTAAQRDRMLHYGYLDPRLGTFILCCDDARFVNHSATPNLEADFTDDPHGVDRAARDIAAGEELTADYRAVEGHAPGALR
jgi:hypothetical protein